MIRLVTVTVILVLLLAVPAAAAPGGANYGGTATYAASLDGTEGLNPLTDLSYTAATITAPIFDSLYTTNASDGKSLPALAQSWKASADQRTYTFKLRKDVQFHDGTPFTAEDVRFSFEVLLHNDNPKFHDNTFSKLVGYSEFRSGAANHISGIAISDPFTISFTLQEVYAPFWVLLRQPILPKHLYCPQDAYTDCVIPVSAMGTSADPYAFAPVGTGPFKWSTYVPGESYTMVANQEYFLGRPYLDSLTIRNLHGENPRFTAGDDVAPVWDYQWLSTQPNLQVVDLQFNGFQTLEMSVTKEPFTDRRVRQAVQFAIDRKQLVQQLPGVHLSPAYTPFASNSWAYKDVSGHYGANPAKARALLDQAGWKVGPDGVRYKNGQPLRFELLYPNTGNQIRIASAPIIQRMLKDVGFDVQLTGTDRVSMFARVFDDRDATAWLIGWSLGEDLDPSGLYGKAAIGPGGYNASEWWTPRSEQLLEEGIRTTDPLARARIYKSWTDEYLAESPDVPLYRPNDLYGVTKRLHNFEPSVVGEGPLWNVHEWWVSK